MPITKAQADNLNRLAHACEDARSELRRVAGEWRDMLDSLIQADDITPGWMLVPKRPTPAMVDAAALQWEACFLRGDDSREAFAECYEVALGTLCGSADAYHAGAGDDEGEDLKREPKVFLTIEARQRILDAVNLFEDFKSAFGVYDIRAIQAQRARAGLLSVLKEGGQ